MSIKVFSVVLSFTFVVFVILHKMSKNKRPARRAFLSLFAGGGALALVNLAGLFTGVYIPVSLLSVLISLAGGIPGVCAMLALNLFV